MQLPIYMDSHATTPVDPQVFEAMLPYFKDQFGNAASSSHAFGWAADKAVERARLQIADLLNADSSEIIFTSGATESNNLALRGIMEMYPEKGNHIITAQTEHKSVLDTCDSLNLLHCDVTVLPVDQYGCVNPDDIRKAITKKTVLVSIMAANNEIGTTYPLEEIGKITRESGIFLHTDAVQAVGKIPFDVESMNIDLASISAHKMYGPKGIGALYVRKKNPRVKVKPILEGGGHERGMRSGTLNVPGIVGMGEACAVCRREMQKESIRLKNLRDKLYYSITETLEDVRMNGHQRQRLPHNLSLAFEGVEGQSLLLGLRNIALSAGSACTSKNPGPSEVLMALGFGEERAFNTVRFGLHRFTKEEEVDYVAEEVVRNVKQLRELSPIYTEPKMA